VTDEAPAGKPRSRKLYVLWAIALTLLLALGLFSWLVVVPVWQSVSLVDDINREWIRQIGTTDDLRSRRIGGFEEEAVARWGGSAHVLPLLRRYNRLPKFLAGEKYLAVRLLGACGKQAVPALVEALEVEPYEAILALDALGSAAKPAIPTLMEIAGRPSDNAFLRANAVALLGKLKLDAAEAVPVLTKIIAEPRKMSGPVYITALEALGKMGPSARIALPQVADCLKSSDVRERLFAARALGEFGDMKAAVPLTNALMDRDERVRQAAAEALQKIKAAQEKK